MNENEVERLLKTYGSSFAPCKAPEHTRRVIRWNRRATFGLASASILALSIVGLWPRNAVAGTVAQINAALRDVKTMECDLSVKLPSGWHTIVRTYYANECWRFDSQIGTNLETVDIVKDGQRLVDCTRDDFVTIEKARPEALADLTNGSQTALDFAKKGVDFGETDIPRTAVVKDHEPVNGRPTYVLSFVRAKDNYRAEILVDKETNLPIQSDMEAADERPKFKGSRQIIHTDFTFNKSLDPHLFSLETQKAVVRPEFAARELAHLWSKPLDSAKGTDIRDATISKDGTIWIVSTVRQSEMQLVLPTFLSDENGTTYARIDDVWPAQNFNEPVYDEIFGKSLCITGFVPLRSGAPVPQKLTVGLASREQWNVARSMNHSIDGQDLKISFLLRPNWVDDQYPAYFPQLSMRSRYLQFGQRAWSARARIFEAHGDLLDAAKSYEEWAKARYDWVKYSAFEPMLDAARCYRAIGQTVLADELTKKAEILKASRER